MKTLIILSVIMSTGFSSLALAAPGDLDTTFDTDGIVTTAFGTADDIGHAIAVQSNGKIIVLGESFNGTNTDFVLSRYNTDGSIDTTFGTDGKVTTAIGSGYDKGYGIAIQSDGMIVVAGFAYNGSNYDFAVARYDTEGSLDTSFDTDGIVTTAIGSGSDVGYAVTIQSDGKIVVAGRAGNGSYDDFAVVRYNTDGSLDTSFDTDGIVTTAIGSSDNIGYAIALQSDGKIVVAGSSDNGSYNDLGVVRYNTDGSLDTTFDTDGIITTDIGANDNLGYAVTIQSDGKIVVAGSANNGSNDDFAVARYNTDGSLDTSFDTDGMLTTAFGTGHDVAYAVAILPDELIVVAGYANNGSADDFAVVRYSADGSLDTSFDTDGIVTTAIGSGGAANAVAIQSDGKIVAAGSVFSGSESDFAVVRYLGSECGNEVVEGTEECDDGATNSDTTADACRSNCTSPSCGDGVTDTGEGCDDGNTTAGDGCSATCEVETSTGTDETPTGGGCSLLPQP